MNEIRDLLEKSQRAFESAAGELQRGNLDFAASRAYYGSFYIAQALLQTEGLRFSRHGTAIAEFGRLFAGSERLDRRFHHLLIRAFRLRQSGDYEARFEVAPPVVLELISTGREFLAAASRYLDALTGEGEGGGEG